MALQTLSSCFRCLMYPQPLILKFLPDVLRLSLAGIEPSDVRKTALVLHLYSTILAWLPTVCPEYCDIASTYDDDDDDDAPTLRSYIELIEDKKGDSSSSSKEKKNEKEMIIRVELSPSEINDQYEELSRYMCQEWCDALLKKFFALLEAQEAEVEGAAQSPLTGLCLYDEMRCDEMRSESYTAVGERERMGLIIVSIDHISCVLSHSSIMSLSSPILGSLGQCAAYLFQSLRPLPVPPPPSVKVGGDSSSSSRSSRSNDSYMKGWQSKQLQQTQLRTDMQSKVIQFFRNTTPLNAAKASAKLMEAMVTSDPSILPHVLNALLTVPLPSSSGSSSSSSLTLVECYSAEKVAFRLRLAGGALRCGTSRQIIPCLPSLLLPIVTSSVYFNHEEKSVRTAVGKLLKDLLKGATSIYPVSLQPNYAGGGRRTSLCAPNVDSENNVRSVCLHACLLACSSHNGLLFIPQRLLSFFMPSDGCYRSNGTCCRETTCLQWWISCDK